MPFTPFHFGPALLFGLLLIAFIEFPTFLVANVIVDLELFLVISLGLNYPLHGFFHSLVGGTLVAVFLALIMFKLRCSTLKVMKFFRLEQKVSWKNVLDAPLYSDIRPFYPFDVNHLLSSSVSVSIYIYMFCVFSFLGGAAIYMLRLAFKAFKKPK